MTQIEQGWGAPVSAHIDGLVGRFRAIFDNIAASAVARELAHELPQKELRQLRQAGFARLRLPKSKGGSEITLPELFNLIIELGAADTSVVNALRSHIGFTEDILNLPASPEREIWLNRIAADETVGSGFSEQNEGVVSTIATRLTRAGSRLVLNGRKFYTSGSLYADWINVGAIDESGAPVGVLVPTKAAGVTILDDWDGFGQSLSASGTAIFENVAVETEWLSPVRERFRYTTAFFQLVHLATLAGVGRAAAGDVARLVAERNRVYSHGNGPRPATDPQILQIVGRVRSAAYVAGAAVLKAAESLQRVYEARLAEDKVAEDFAGSIADLEVSQSVAVVTDLILDAATLLFDALGASASRKTLGLDRHWRNARTIASHNPRIYHHRSVGDFAVNGKLPAPNWGRGLTRGVVEPSSVAVS